VRSTDINRFVEPESVRPGAGAAVAANTTWMIIRRFFGVTLKTILGVVLVGIITGIIVGISLVFYVVSLSGEEADFKLSAVKLRQTSFVYNTDANGNTSEHARLHGSENRVWVDLKRIPEYMRDAYISIEDERFDTHKGVDWKRTIAAAANLFVGFDDNTFGASTITQQLIKNRTGDDEVSLNRKITEIFKALNLEKKYSKQEILESYLNVIALGNGCNGVQAAANTYFGKDVDELSLAESASIAAITQNPSKYNPLRNPENNKKRQEDVLTMMKKNERITEAEYQEAIKEELVFKKKKQTETVVPIWDYYVDLIIEDIIADLMAGEMNYSRQAAIDSVYNGGLKIYSAVDTKMQKILEDIYYENDDCLPGDVSMQSATLVMGYDGRVLGTIGGRGKKPSNRCLNRSTQSQRQPGSAIKPLAAYAPAIEANIAWWSKAYPDEMLTIRLGGRTIQWPKNASRTYHPNMLIQKAIQISSNCVAARVVKDLSPERSFEFLRDKLGFTSLVELWVNPDTGRQHTDMDLSPLATGGMTKGVTIREMSAGYAVFGNGGKYYKPYTYYKVEDYTGDPLINSVEKPPVEAIAEGTSSEMNKLLQTVIQGGTGSSARLSGGWTIFGKTGTTSDNKDRWFVGGTPLCVAAVWTGYDMPASIAGSANPGIRIWNEIMKQYHEGETKKDFEYPGITTKRYCIVTGYAPQSYCSTTGVGWFRRDVKLPPCNGDHSLATTESGSSEASISSEESSSGSEPSSEDKTTSTPDPSGPSSSRPPSSRPPSSRPPSSRPPSSRPPSSRPDSSSSSESSSSELESSG